MIAEKKSGHRHPETNRIAKRQKRKDTDMRPRGHALILTFVSVFPAVAGLLVIQILQEAGW